MAQLFHLQNYVREGINSPTNSPESAARIEKPHCIHANYAPEWVLVKQCEGTTEPIPLSDTDMYMCRCPECGKAVPLGTEEFFDLVAEERLDILGCGVYCPSCAKKIK